MGVRKATNDGQCADQFLIIYLFFALIKGN